MLNETINQIELAHKHDNPWSFIIFLNENFEGGEVIFEGVEYKPKKGDVFNFKEFNAIIKTAVPIQTNIKLLKQAAESSSTKTTILTARLLGYPVKSYLKKLYNLDVYIVALGDGNPQKKADYIEKEIKKGYNDIVFIDDSHKNVKAVEALQSQYPNVNLKVIHTTEAEHIKF